ncbi:hypothetical protein DY000_02040978 [Brassica cretica]|uniref:Uncharacterized protein n=1 Tax=Brassica cretica TaxID=69181 RepID=A0ABQ7BFF4_BRACR|nr:hypothetical protein DY000_02040978 [Brassica cretica]
MCSCFRERTSSEGQSMLWPERRSILLQTSVIAQINNVQLDLDQLSASVGLKICSTHILASPSIDGKGAPSIDSPFVLSTALSRDRLTTPQ